MENDEELDYCKQLINEYEVILPAINEQLQYYKSEYGALKREIVNLANENRILAEKLEECAKNHMAVTTFSYKENDLIDNLKNQLDLSLKEKDSVVELWRTSMTRIDFLENELKIYSAGSENANKTLIRKLKKTFENEVKTLRENLKCSEHKLRETASLSKTSLAHKKDELESLGKNQRESEERIRQLAAQLQTAERKLTEVMQSNQDLQKSLGAAKDRVENEKLENYNAKLKVAEACHIIEAALLEKDAAIAREQEAHEEVRKLTATIDEIVAETHGKVRAEIHAAKEEFANRLHAYKLDLKKCQEDLAMRTLEVHKKSELCAQLQSEIDDLRNGKTEVLKEKQAWSDKAECGKEKLITSEKRNSHLRQQLKHLTLVIEKQKAQHSDALCNMEIEKKRLESQVHTLQNELSLSNARFQQVTARVDDLGRRMSGMDLQFKEELSLKNAESERNLTERLNEVECVNARINQELKAQLGTQISMHHRWKSEVRTLTEKLESRIRALTNELIKLRSKNAELARKLESSERKRLEYKEHLKTLCTEFNTIANVKP